MLRLKFYFAGVLLAGLALPGWTQESTTTVTASAASLFVGVPAGTSVGFLFVRPVWAKTANAGDTVYMQTTFPVVAANSVVIPSGSYLQGTITGLVRPTNKNRHALVTIAFAKLIFPSGYAVVMKETQTLNVQVSTANDLLLDNGTQAEITLQQPLQLRARQVAASLALAQPVHPETFTSATRCVPTEGTPGSPGTPGTPDIVIPGNPGTPDTVIPGADGAPDTVIPGIPATPPTVIPGTPGTPDDPGTPGTSCPNPPLVVGSTPTPSATSAMQPATSSP
jgi:hypothetical protein